MIKKGDTVYVRTGSDKGRTGRVLKVDRKKMTILVEGVNKRQKHQRPTQKQPKGGIITMERPIHLSNVALIIQTDKGPVPTRVKTKVIDDGGRKVRVRVSCRTGEQI
jgi:large subunit ribosomal protein L24